jgi:hypothetical protein
MNWAKPVWAGFSVVTVSLDTTGASLERARAAAQALPPDHRHRLSDALSRLHIVFAGKPLVRTIGIAERFGVVWLRQYRRYRRSSAARLRPATILGLLAAWLTAQQLSRMKLARHCEQPLLAFSPAP